MIRDGDISDQNKTPLHDTQRNEAKYISLTNLKIFLKMMELLREDDLRPRATLALLGKEQEAKLTKAQGTPRRKSKLQFTMLQCIFPTPTHPEFIYLFNVDLLLLLRPLMSPGGPGGH